MSVISGSNSRVAAAAGAPLLSAGAVEKDAAIAERGRKEGRARGFEAIGLTTRMAFKRAVLEATLQMVRLKADMVKFRAQLTAPRTRSGSESERKSESEG